MAGDWIPMRLDLVEDPAVLEMADILDQPEEFIVGSLHRVWSWASRNCHCGTVTGVTILSLGRVTRNVEFIRAMVKVGWLIESTDESGRPCITFPKWENWLSGSAKERINNARNQRNSRKRKELAAAESSDVTNLSLSDSDKTVTTGQYNTVDNTHTHTAPDWLEKDWKRWCNYGEARDGRPMDAILSETVLMDLMRRGDGKAQRDIEFSILKQARSILDSDNDFSKRTGQASSGTGSRRYGKPTAEEIYKQREAENPPTPEDIEARERILKLQKEMWDESIRR